MTQQQIEDRFEVAQATLITKLIHWCGNEDADKVEAAFEALVFCLAHDEEADDAFATMIRMSKKNIALHNEE